MSQDYYEILGVKKNATDEEIIKFDTLITLYEEKIERQRKK